MEKMGNSHECLPAPALCSLQPLKHRCQAVGRPGLMHGGDNISKLTTSNSHLCFKSQPRGLHMPLSAVKQRQGKDNLQTNNLQINTGREGTKPTICYPFSGHGAHMAAPSFLCWKASLPAQDTGEFHQGSYIWKQQLLIPCIHIQTPNVLNSQNSYCN